MNKACKVFCDIVSKIFDFFKGGGIAYVAAVFLNFMGASLLPKTPIGGNAGVAIAALFMMLNPILTFALIDNLLADYLHSKTNQTKASLLVLVCGLLLFLVVGANLYLTNYMGMVRIFLHLTSLVFMAPLTSLIVELVKTLRQ